MVMTVAMRVIPMEFRGKVGEGEEGEPRQGFRDKLYSPPVAGYRVAAVVDIALSRNCYLDIFYLR